MPRGAKPTCDCGACTKCRRREYNREYQRRYYHERGLTDEQKQRKRDKVREWREANPERERENSRRYQQTLAYREYQRRWREENREALNAKMLADYHALDEEGKRRWAARGKLNQQVRTGKIQKEPCLVCDDPNVHAHHHDYDKPLDVTWLCARHHKMAHR